MLGWDYFTEQHTFSCADGAPKCPLQGASRADVGDAVETALEQLNRRYQPRLRFQKQRLLNGYRRFDPARGMEYTLDLLLEAVTQRGHRRALARRVSLLRPLSTASRSRWCRTPPAAVWSGGPLSRTLSQVSTQTSPLPRGLPCHPI